MIAKDCYNAYIDIQFINLIILNLHDSKVQRFLQRIYSYEALSGIRGPSSDEW